MNARPFTPYMTTIIVSCLTSFLVISLLASFYVFYFCDETPMVGANLSYENARNNDTTLDILGDYNRATFENTCSGVGGCNCTLGMYIWIVNRVLIG